MRTRNSSVLPAPVVNAAWSSARPPRRWEPRGDLWALVLHHTQVEAGHLRRADPRDEAAYMRAIEAIHLARGWDALGYHVVVMPSGRSYAGRPIAALGAHVLGHNTGTVGIALAGDFERERPTLAALNALHTLRSLWLRAGDSVPLLAHRDLADTGCPGDLLFANLPWLRGENGDSFAHPSGVVFDPRPGLGLDPEAEQARVARDGGPRL